MKPTFALNITDDGFVLLHRTAKGWTSVGETLYSAPDLPEAMAYLRNTALGLQPKGMTTKLVIPNSQILYTEVEAPGPSDSARRKQIAAALKGRTPYEVSDLVFDWSGKGPKLQVVAVAKETLKQAEEFAVEHRLNPMSFVAIPEPGTFDGEPYFGMTAFAPGHLKAGETVERDPEPILPLVRSLPQAEPAPAPAPAPEPVAKAEPAPAPAPVVAEPAPPPVAAAPAPEPERAAPVAKAEPEPVAPLAPPPAPPKSEALPVEPGRLAASLMPKAAEPVPEAPFAEVPETLSATDLDDVPDMPGAPPRGGLPDDVPPAPAPSIRVAFASRRSAAEMAAPPLSVPSSVPPAAATAVGRPAGGAIGVAPPIGSPTAEPPRPRVVRDKPIEDLPPLQRPVFAAPKAPAAQPAPRGAVAKSFGAVMSAPGMPGAKKKAKVAIATAGAQPGAAGVGTLPGTGAGAAGPARTLQPTKPLTKPGGTFGTPPKSGKPRYLGLMLTALLLVFLGLVAAWSSFYLSADTTPEDGTATAALESGGAAITPPEAVAPEASAEAAAEAPAIEDEMLADGELPEAGVDAAEVADLPPDAAEPPVDVEADAVAAAVATGSPAVSSTDVTVASSNQTEPDAPVAAAPATEAPVAQTAAAPLAEPATEATAAVTEAQEPLSPPPGTAISSDVPAAATLIEDQDEIFLAGTDAPPPALDALALPLPEQSGDPPPGAQAPPPPFGTVYQFDDRGLIRPTPEGIMTPEGVMLFAGPPPVLPPERPASVLEAAAAAAAPPPAADTSASAEATAPAEATASPPADPALSGFRPRARPEGLSPPSADDAAAPLDSATQVTSLRPRERPPTVLSASEAARQQSASASLALQAGAEAAVDAALAEDTSNPSLLAISRRPTARPKDFDRAVGAAVELAVAEAVREPEAEPQAEAAVALPEDDQEPELAAVAPSAPLKGTVAKKATFVNALNLSKVNLIGVYGTDSRRYALVRQANGRFKKVRVGDRIDGGQVAAITASEVRYQKDGRLVSLKLPRS